MQELFDPLLLDALEDSTQELWEGHLWRQVVASTDPFRTNGLGGRWNPPGVEVLYCSLAQSGAEAELSALLDRQSVRVTRPRPFYRLSVRLSRVGRVWDSPAYELAGVSTEAALSDDWSLAQTLGAAADWLGLAGLIVPSARHESENLVILVNRLAPNDYYEIDDEFGGSGS